jgi:HAD superfamily hydrolase (TIGR01549 family)
MAMTEHAKGGLAVVLDVDGTLVDTNYQHALAWHLAFRAHGRNIPAWRAHRHIGMGGDRLVAALAGDDFEEEHGDDVRESEQRAYERFIGEVVPLHGADELLDALNGLGHRVVLASSAREEEVEHYLDLLDARDRVEDWTTSADVDSTKPSPELVEVALEKAGGRPGVMIGDSVWDVAAAKRAGVQCVSVLTGGFGEAELREAGAAAIFASLPELVAELEPALRGAVVA